jgi:hypothetical protein
LEEYLETVDQEGIDLKTFNPKAVYMEALNLEAVVREACALAVGTPFIRESSMWECREFSTIRSTES